jgi:hypothetical protein
MYLDITLIKAVLVVIKAGSIRGKLQLPLVNVQLAAYEVVA